MPYSDPEKNREARRRYKATDKAKLKAKLRRDERKANDPEYVANLRAIEKAYRDRYPDRVKAKNARSYEAQRMNRRESQLRALYGIGHADYERMLAEQNGQCAICGASSPGRGDRYFCVDHDHTTGKVRAILCDFCNNGLGRFRDDVDLLRKAIAYLERHQKLG